MLRWIIVIVMLALLFSSCDKCKIETKQTLEIYYSQPVIHNNGSWSNTSGAVIADDMISDIRSQFRQPDQLSLVQSQARFVVSIDSISCNSGTNTETVADPCWKSQGWVLDQLYPQPHYTYNLNNVSIEIYFTITDTLTHLSKFFQSGGTDGQTLYLPPADSTHCYGYEVQGTYDETFARDRASSAAYCDLKCIIKDWLNGH
ncbi:MAG TPA: hypothetical protein VFJ43_05290 [Bacteroidia bacterium]|nr:hypothetical protein [Bacteroidia bacterium]